MDNDRNSRSREEKEDGAEGVGKANRGAMGEVTPSKMKRRIVVPGEFIEKSGRRTNSGIFQEKGRLYSCLLGLLRSRRRGLTVLPVAGKYIPGPNDEVIGKIVDVRGNGWSIDINSPYKGDLHYDNTPWDIGYGETGEYLALGDLVLTRVQFVDALKRVKLSMERWECKRLQNGLVIEVSCTKVPRVIGKGGSMIRLLKNRTRTRILVGQNGRIWLDGDPERILIAVKAIEMIEKDAHKMGLTERIGDFLEREMRGRMGSSENAVKDDSVPEKEV